jgi:protein-S-isoprenylcysteine O-methyltransferase Ste14
MTSTSSPGNKRFRKISMVSAGYLAALVLAFLAVAVRMATTSGPDAQASSGMYAFGDALLFVAVFGTVGLLPTGLGLVFLRPYRPFWLILSTIGAVIAATAVIALVLFAIGRSATAPSSLSTWAAVLRILPCTSLRRRIFGCSRHFTAPRPAVDPPGSFRR